MHHFLDRRPFMRIPYQRLLRVGQTRDVVELGLVDHEQVHAFGQGLAQRFVGILVAAMVYAGW
jgi:hypothetical protein